MQAQLAAQKRPAPDEGSSTLEELAELRAQNADLESQLSEAEARCEELRRRLAAAEGQLTSSKVAAAQATLAAQVGCRVQVWMWLGFAHCQS